MDLSIALALVAAAFLGTAVVIANVGLRYLDPARGALVSIPSTTLLFWLPAVFLFRGDGWNATAFAIFAVVGLIFPALVTFLNFASNRLTGPTVAGTVSSTTPLFAVLGGGLSRRAAHARGSRGNRGDRARRGCAYRARRKCLPWRSPRSRSPETHPMMPRSRATRPKRPRRPAWARSLMAA